MRLLSARWPRRAIILATVCAALAGVLVLLLDDGPDAPPKVVANDLSGRPTACLAADSTTASGSQRVAEIWSSMQHAAHSRPINVQQLILPAKSPADAQPHVAGLLNRHCSLIVTVGPAFGQATTALVSKSPAGTRFTTIDASLTTPPSGITALNGKDAAAAVANEIRGLSTTSGPSPSSHRS
ncbi:hypothetical protein [Streptomyces sp. NPDC051994]|uniref:hypothetical protein n=1 Tax=unclassified Streptomyces TaxID=2593676 RepID=UPI003437189B